MLTKENKGLSVLMLAMFSSFITNPAKQTGLSDFKELQNTAFKPQSTVFRHCVWAVRELQIHPNSNILKTSFPPFFYF